MIGNTYEEAFDGFIKQGLYLDEEKENFKSNEKSKCHCLKHPDNKMEYAWKYVKMGRFSCKECKKENKRKDLTIDEKINIINKKGFIYCNGNLKNVLNKINIKCGNGHIFPITFNNLNKSLEVNCPFCNGTVPNGYWNKYTCQKWINENNINYTILETKIENKELKVYIKCEKRHEPYWCSWGHFRNNETRCEKCYYESKNRIYWTLDKAKEILLKNGYKMIDETQYVSSHKRVDCIDKLGFKYPVSIHYITQGRCKFSLWKNNKYAVDNVKNFCKLYRPDYEFASEKYFGNKSIHRWKYLGNNLDDGIDREFDLMFGSFINGCCGHPFLSKSKLESTCQFLLEKHNIEYKTQKTFDGCIYKIKLRFDFYIKLNDIEYCIEVDGNQHDMPIDIYGGVEGFIKTQIRDNIKTKYCKDNNIKLIRIKEREFKNMENILIKELNLEEDC